jgi:hypothetical protein
LPSHEAVGRKENPKDVRVSITSPRNLNMTAQQRKAQDTNMWSKLIKQTKVQEGLKCLRKRRPLLNFTYVTLPPHREELPERNRHRERVGEILLHRSEPIQ